MDEAWAQRDAIADGVAQGYAEINVAAKVWRGSPKRWWRDASRPGVSRGLTGAALESAVMALALSRPEYVRMVYR